jgi:1-deoxy-D-xylulose-5-phosphate reductoisomerase
LVLNAIGGVEGLEATQAAVEQGKDLALANKESLVVAGALVTREAKQKGTKLLPVDSEHVAVHQCLSGQARMIDRLVLTASGGPFYRWPAAALNTVTPAMAVNHPTWRMGPKISVDSATLMNKALEVIEAHWLFGTPLAQIEVVIHPQSIVHSLVVFGDGMALAQVGPPDMRLPIQYALSWPETLPNRYVSWSVTNLPTLTFEPPDEKNFPCLRLGREAAERGGSYPAVLAGADEEAVALFLEGRIRFTDIPRIVEEVLAEHRPMGDLTWGNLKEVVGWARRRARQRGENLWARR